jgi:hypothetical protein
VPVEVAAFIAGACWARQVIVAEKEEQRFWKALSGRLALRSRRKLNKFL